MLPMISDSLHLSDTQGAFLTSGYSYLYALALLPIGLIADRAKRPMLLGAGVAAWSGLTLAAANVAGFPGLLAARIGLAAAHSTQNVICFSMIPDLFPVNKSTALAFYNCAIYVGRGLMYLSFNHAREVLASQPAVIDAAAGSLVQTDALGNLLVPLDKLDLRLVQLVYTSGDMAAIRTASPLYGLSMAAEAAGLNDAVWRQVMQTLALPGALLAVALMLTVPETRKALPAAAPAPAAVALDEPPSVPAQAPPSGLRGIMALLRNQPLMTVTAAAALNDVASYALIAWQSTLYERVYHLEVTQYAPMLAAILPLSGIVGGVGGGLLADRLAQIGQRAWVTVATSLLAAPLIWASLCARTPDESFLALSIGFALSEAWRAPAAVMARSVVPVEQTSTAMSVYLCLRNLIGGMGPILVAQLSHQFGLQHAMEVLPPMYIASAALFWQAEGQLKAREEALARADPATALAAGLPSSSPAAPSDAKLPSPVAAPASPAPPPPPGTQRLEAGSWRGRSWSSRRRG